MRRFAFLQSGRRGGERSMKQEIAMIFLFWFALQLPLAIAVGKFIHFGMSENDGKDQAASFKSIVEGATVAA
jgi:hypothetical protein